MLVSALEAFWAAAEPDDLDGLIAWLIAGTALENLIRDATALRAFGSPAVITSEHVG